MKRSVRSFTLDSSAVLRWGFFSALFALFIGFCLSLDLGKGLAENRRLEERFNLKDALKRPNDLPAKFNRYWNDNFGFRKGLIKVAQVWLDSGVLSADGMVVHGKNGRLFFFPAFDVSLYREGAGKKDETDGFWLEYFRALKASLDSKGLPLFVLIVPNANSVCVSDLPQALRPPHPAYRGSRLCSELREAGISCVYPGDFFEAQTNPCDYYLSTDTHWNGLGAFHGYRLVAQNIKKVYPNFQPSSLEDFDLREEMITGNDLALMLGKADLLPSRQITLVPKIPAKPSPLKPLVFHDSCLLRQTEYLQRDFPLYVKHNDWGKAMTIEKKSGDFVLFEIVERHLVGMPDWAKSGLSKP